MDEQKKCFKCDEEKPLSEFYSHSEMGDGHLGKCKECTCADMREHRLSNTDKIRAYDRERSCEPNRKALAAAGGRKRRKEHPERAAASQKAKRALQAGHIEKRPCYFCGSEVHIEMHHPDYSRPLRIYWLCRTCHRKMDAMLKL